MASIKNDRPLTLSRLKELLDYDPTIGLFIWRTTISPKAVIGSVAGIIRSHGYRMIVVDGGQYKASRLAWFYIHGAWPIGYLDHVNRTRSDDRLSNLREVTEAENCWNAGKSKRNSTGIRGVSKSPRGGYQAMIMQHGKHVWLGRYDNLEDAAAARKAAAFKLHGEFASELR